MTDAMPTQHSAVQAWLSVIINVQPPAVQRTLWVVRDIWLEPATDEHQ